ncbi:MAG: hypothetical protein PUP91_13290 [Rhizonema sp. PD37]|nr:hypothetical protein [Rhizonema sp. PD37]
MDLWRDRSLNGKTFSLMFTQNLTPEYFQQFLDWLSQQLGNDYAILQIDQAPAHVSSAIHWPENIITNASTSPFSRT